MFTVKDTWESFLRDVVGDNPTTAQTLTLLRCAFYGGATALFYGIIAHATKTLIADEVTDDDLAMMDKIEAELFAFALEMGGTTVESAPDESSAATRHRLTHTERGNPRQVIDAWQRLARQDKEPN